MAEKSQKSEVRSQKIFSILDFRITNLKSQIVNRKSQIILLLSAFCILFTVFSGCAGRQIIITKDPLKAEEHIKLAQVYEAKGETELAVQEYKKALEQDKTSSMAYFGLGNIAFKKGQYADAEGYYKKTIENTPADDLRNAMFYNNISWIYIETNRELKQAEKLTQKALDLDSAKMRIYLDTLGVIYTKLNEYTKAEDALLSALKNSSDDKTALRHINMHLVELYQLKGDKDKLHEAAERLRGLDK
ncbi:MAG: tetratricopeptide repeat protein [Deltaproteobacteria bacterium]|nr:tetratricopeptide repeat protein [Deltaproteobacteria bacterium]